MVAGIKENFAELMDITDSLKRKVWAAEPFTWEEIEFALSQVTEEKDKGLYGLVCYYAAFYMINNGRLEECLSYLNESIRCMGDTELEGELCRCYHMSGVVAQAQNNLVLAMEHYERARIYAKQHNRRFIYCLAVGNMANTYGGLGSYDRAISEYEECIREMKQLGGFDNNRENMYCKMLAGYGYYLLMNGRIKDAHIIAEEVNALLEKNAYIAAVELTVYVFLAYLAYKSDEERKAEEYTDLAVRVVMKSDNIVADFDTILKLLQYLVEVGKYKQLQMVLVRMEPQAAIARNEGFLLQLLLYRLQYCSDGMSREEFMGYAQNFFGLKSKYEYSENNQVLRIMKMRNKLRQIEEEQTRLMEENTKLIYQTQHDELTGLYNKRHMNRHMEEMFEEAMRKELPLGVMFVDIDYFKQMNDRYGHQQGDECIIRIAEAIKTCFAEDFAARYGGDEFVIITLGQSKEYMDERAQMLIDNIKERKIPNADSPCMNIVTVTIGGVHAVPHKPNKMWDFLSAADETLYQQKNEQRGMARFYEGQEDGL